jgi:hypothetical protein
MPRTCFTGEGYFRSRGDEWGQQAEMKVEALVHQGSQVNVIIREKRAYELNQPSPCETCFYFPLEDAQEFGLWLLGCSMLKTIGHEESEKLMEAITNLLKTAATKNDGT